MALSNIWTAKYGGVTQPCSAWGMSKVAIDTESGKTGTLKFLLDGAAFNSGTQFAYRSPFMLYRAGVPFFQGWVSSIPRRANSRGESVSYIISDAWWWLDNIFFQQQWVTCDPAGGGTTTMTTTRSRILLAQSLNGVKMNLGQVMLEVLYYALYACQGIPFPTTVNVSTSLPTPPSMTAGPFQIGDITPSITVPYSEVTDKKCSEIIKTLMRYVPDAVQWIDHSTTPPTLNIDSRANLDGKTISVLAGNLLSEFNPEPRDDLQVPAVFAKYESKFDNNGTDMDLLSVDSYPPGVLDNAPFAFVQTVDLLGGGAAFQKQDITSAARPLTGTETTAMLWLQQHLSADAYLGIDLANAEIAVMKCVVNPGDKALAAPYDMPADGTGYNFELVSGAVQEWMWDNGGYLSAEATLTFFLTYGGGDAVTHRFFAAQSTAGVLPIPIKVKITNAQTKTYQQETSFQQPEPVPVGNAEYLYNVLNKLHQQGDLSFSEPEVTNQLPIGCIFNTTDGLADWQTMDALVLRVSLDLDQGITKVKFGPTVNQSMQNLVALARANRGRLFSWKLNQRTTGEAGSGNTTQGHTHSAASSASMTPGNQSAAQYRVYIRMVPPTSIPFAASFQMMVDPSSQLFGDDTEGSIIPITGIGEWRTLIANDLIWLEITTAGGVASAAAIRSLGNGDSGYDPTADYWATGSVLENDGGSPPIQTLARITIAKTGAASSIPNRPPDLDQRISGALAMRDCARGGGTNPCLAASYPFPLG
jgi:hypothetical protein